MSGEYLGHPMPDAEYIQDVIEICEEYGSLIADKQGIVAEDYARQALIAAHRRFLDRSYDPT